MDVVETFVWNDKVTNGRDGVSNHLSLLAVETFSRPSGDVLTHGGPNYFGADGLTRALHAWVAEAVNGVEDNPPECLRDERPGRAVADVDDKVGTTDVNILEI